MGQKRNAETLEASSQTKDPQNVTTTNNSNKKQKLNSSDQKKLLKNPQLRTLTRTPNFRLPVTSATDSEDPIASFLNTFSKLQIKNKPPRTSTASLHFATSSPQFRK